ncbi:UNVERIFIED_CONTAM: hypothetical protein Sindi_2489100 [Sesamum indicum]
MQRRVHGVGGLVADGGGDFQWKYATRMGSQSGGFPSSRLIFRLLIRALMVSKTRQQQQRQATTVRQERWRWVSDGERWTIEMTTEGAISSAVSREADEEFLKLLWVS